MRLRELLEDKPMTLLEAAAYIGKITGQKPHISTVYRWCRKGCKGVRLECLCIGSRHFVTPSALDLFVEQSTLRSRSESSQQSSNLPTPVLPEPSRPARHNDRRRSEIEAARRRLDELTRPNGPPSAPAASQPATRSA